MRARRSWPARALPLLVLLAAGCRDRQPTASVAAPADAPEPAAAARLLTAAAPAAPDAPALAPPATPTAPAAEATPQPPAALAPGPDCRTPAAKPSCKRGYCTIPAGCFVMGAPRDEPGVARFNDRQVQVTLTRSFLAGQTEVTRKQWRAAGFALPARKVVVGSGECTQDACPIGNVTFFDAVAFANRLSEQEQLPPCYDVSACHGEVGRDYACPALTITAPSIYECRGYRLPSEAEWEYMARAGTSTPFPSGDFTRRALPETAEPTLDAIAWYGANSGGKPRKVGLRKANAWGLHDTAGNVFELCNDLYDPKGYGAGPWVDPAGTRTSGRDLMLAGSEDPPRIARGGNHVSDSVTCKSNHRFHVGSGLTNDGLHAASDGIGFRLVRTLP